MKRIISLRIFIAAICFFSPVYCLLTANYCLYAEDKIVAIVNEEVITQKDLRDFINFMRLQLSRDYKGRELEEKIGAAKAGLLDRLIEDRLILQEAKKAKISVDEERIKARVQEAKKTYGTDMKFQQELMRQGLTQADIEKKIREQLLMFNIVESCVRSKIAIRPEEVTAFYAEHKKELSSRAGREFEAISLENEDLARSVAYNLKAGAKLADLAARYPLTVSNLSVDKGEELKKEIESAVSGLGVREVSDPVKIDDKYYIFRLVNITSAQEPTLLDAQNKIKDTLFEQKMQAGMEKWVEEIKKNAYIKIAQD